MLFRRLTCGSRVLSPPERRGRYHGPFKLVNDFPPARTAYSWRSTTRHVDTFTQKRRPAPRPSGRQDGHRTAVGSNPVGVRRPPVFRCRRRRRRPERSSVSKNVPAYSLEKVAPCSTACQLAVGRWTPTTTTVPAESGARRGRCPGPSAGAIQHNGSRWVGIPAAQDRGGSLAGRRRTGERRPTLSRWPSSSSTSHHRSTESTGWPSSRTAP
jgi:hypothetical protein